MENKKIIRSSNLALADFMKNFEILLTSIQYNDKQINKESIKKKSLFQKLYQKAFSENYAEEVCILLLEDKNRKKWTVLFEDLQKKMNLIPDSFTNSSNTSIFNKFKNLYNKIYKLLEIYFKIIKNIKSNDNYNNDINLRLLYNDKSIYNIENIYSLIELTNRTVHVKETLSFYYKSMLELQKTKKKKVIKNEDENKYVPKEVNNKLPKDESKYNFALNQSEQLLIKVRKLRFSLKGDEQLNIGLLYYNLRRIVQILVILKNTIKYYHVSKNYIINENLRTNLLTLIQTLQGTISRSNELEDPEKERNRLAIRSAFKRRLFNESLNENDFVHDSINNANKLLGLDFRKKAKNNLEFKNIP